MPSSQEPFPSFPYHPDPISTKCVEESDEACACCGKNKGYLCSIPPNCEDEVGKVCPWCVSDGSAAKKFDAIFNHDYYLEEEGYPQEIIDEVSLRTPGFPTWNLEQWKCCCNDVCIFHGDVPKEELRSFQGELLEKFLSENNMPADYFEEFKGFYEPGGSPCVFKFECKHCDQIHYVLDFS